MSCVVADAGPLIALARIECLPLLHELYGAVVVPPRVLAELGIDSDRPGALALRRALAAGWFEVVEASTDLAALGELPVDPGEAEAIWLARHHTDLRFLLIDERRGRQLARQLGLPVVGTAGVLLVAKQQGLVQEVRSMLLNLSEIGYHLSPRLCAEMLRLAGEDS
ncbi:MAG: DUF3368 domain-containing protein [Thermoanaerobaculia bacterium]|nr:DUF3368 domain-containing protein [Thermoanaerobaculia bacterium]